MGTYIEQFPVGGVMAIPSAPDTESLERSQDVVEKKGSLKCLRLA